MESAGTTPHVAVSAPDLVEVVQDPGPYATVYLTTEAGIDNAAQRNERRWRQVRDELAGQGAPESLLEQIDGLVPDAHREGQSLAVVGTEQGVLHVEHHPEVLKHDNGRWAALPSLVPLLEWRQMSPPHVAVLADRSGADIIGFRRELPDLYREAGTGNKDAVHKVQAGGWSQRRYHERAENTWEENAEAAAAEVTKLVERIGARLVVAAGDTRALTVLREALPREVLDMLVEVDGGRGADGSDEEFSVGVARAVATAVASDTVAIVEKFREELGQGDRACDGPARTIEALRQGQVEVLLINDDLESDRTAWFGDGPTMLGLSADDVRGLGAEHVQEARLHDVLVRAALGTSAGIRVVPHGAGPADGIGAVLRWS
ncbi:MAG TPA: Vms1/Ankzf1 family peptidyl-tRNA hydrolase [Acidimicrobiales bacterium]|nr:Vms1/Ankzf1 family peptidyl-tRNA hydrolase [Acidimicrobiales bacterium]